MKILLSILILLMAATIASKSYSETIPPQVEQEKKASKTRESNEVPKKKIEQKSSGKPVVINNFIPTEKVSADSIITFPTDI